MPCTSLSLTSYPAARIMPPRMRLVRSVPCPPTPTIIIFFVSFTDFLEALFTVFLSPFFAAAFTVFLAVFFAATVFFTAGFEVFFVVFFFVSFAILTILAYHCLFDFNFLKLIELAQLNAQSASVAHCCVHAYSAVCILCDCRTSRLETCAALFAVSRKCFCFIRELLSFKKRARIFCDDNAELVVCRIFLNNFFKAGKVKRTHFAHFLYSECVADCSDVDCRNFFSLQRFSCACVILMSCHACRAVVENNDCSCRLIVRHILKRVDSCVHECTVADNCNPVFNVFAAFCFFHAVQRAY